MESYHRLVENLGKLQRNESQFTEEQKIKYAAPLQKLKKQILEDAREVGRLFVMSGCRLMNRDKDSADWKNVIRKAERFMDEWSGADGSTKASRVLFSTYDVDLFLEALLPLHHKIWYEAYGPYWLKHCSPTDEDEFTHTNDIIGMEWWAKWNLWTAVKTDSGEKEPDYLGGCMIMLPPTKELLEEAYRKDREGMKFEN